MSTRKLGCLLSKILLSVAVKVVPVRTTSLLKHSHVRRPSLVNKDLLFQVEEKEGRSRMPIFFLGCRHHFKWEGLGEESRSGH